MPSRCVPVCIVPFVISLVSYITKIILINSCRQFFNSVPQRWVEEHFTWNSYEPFCYRWEKDQTGFVRSQKISPYMPEAIPNMQGLLCMSNRSTFVQNRNENHALEAVEDQRQEKQLRPLTRFTLRVSSVHYFQIVTVGGLWHMGDECSTP
jgi:hypothetical protein